ncbi:MAG: flippase-like domain-containing protein [Bdellovibrionales bacterium]|nr:flippase-like domain-containing protein [Bdellovibrionales bacterium]
MINIKTWIGFALSFVVCLYLIQTIQVHDVLLALRQLKVSYLIIALVFDFLCIISKSQLWRALIEIYSKMSRQYAFRLYVMGLAMNSILPFRMGDLGKSMFLAKDRNVHFRDALTSVLAEGGLQIAAIILLATVIVFLEPNPLLENSLLLVSGSLFVGMLILLGFKKLDYAFLKIPHISLKFSMMGWSVLSLVFYILSVMYTLKSCGIILPYLASILLIVFLTLSAVIPAAPGRLGTFEATVLLVLTWFKVPFSQAIGFALVLHLVQTIPICIYGASFFVTLPRFNANQNRCR